MCILLSQFIVRILKPVNERTHSGFVSPLWTSLLDEKRTKNACTHTHTHILRTRWIREKGKIKFKRISNTREPFELVLIYTRTRYSILTNIMCCHAQWFFVVVGLKLWIRFIWFDKKWADVMLLLMRFVDVHRLCRPNLFFEPIFFFSIFLYAPVFQFFCWFSSASNNGLNSYLCVCVFF